MTKKTHKPTKSRFFLEMGQISSKIRGVLSGPEPDKPKKPKKSKKSTRRRPGKLTGSFSISFDTRDAIDLLQGRPQHGDQFRIYSMNDFANRMYDVWMSVAAGDPFAEYQLVQTEALLNQTDQRLRQMADELNAKLKASNTSYVYGEDQTQILMSKPNSVAPMRFEFRYGYHGSVAVRHLKQTDDILTMILSLRHMAIITREEARLARSEAWQQMRVIKSSGAAWRRTGVTRRDLTMCNRIARSAVHKLAQSQFLDMEMYRNVEDVCEVFAKYDGQARYGPKSADRPEPVPDSLLEADTDGPTGDPES